MSFPQLLCVAWCVMGVLPLCAEAAESVIGLRNGDVAIVEILDTAGCHVTILRKGMKTKLRKKHIQFIVIAGDTLRGVSDTCSISRKKRRSDRRESSVSTTAPQTKRPSKSNLLDQASSLLRRLQQFEYSPARVPQGSIVYYSRVPLAGARYWKSNLSPEWFGMASGHGVADEQEGVRGELLATTEPYLRAMDGLVGDLSANWSMQEKDLSEILTLTKTDSRGAAYALLVVELDVEASRVSLRPPPQYGHHTVAATSQSYGRTYVSIGVAVVDLRGTIVFDDGFAATRRGHWDAMSKAFQRCHRRLKRLQ